MDNKKILMSFILVVLIAISASAVSAADAVAVDEQADVIAVDDATDALEVDDSAEVIAETIQPNTTSVADVQAAVSKAKTGDTVDLSKYAEYDFTNQTVAINTDGITVDGKGTTTIKGYGDGNGIFAIKAKNVVIQGIKFIDTNPKNDFKYNGTVQGWAISATQANGGIVQNCEFYNFSSGVVVMQTKGYTIQDSKFDGGYSTLLANDPTVNKEQGTKALNIYKQSAQVLVKNNTFTGPMLDGVSIAQGSGSNQVIGNTFIGNCYSIYFGGASTVGSTIRENKFINCGFFKEGSIFWEGLPIISIQKSSDDIAIENNYFQAINNNVLIAAEKGNEAHGFPTPIGNINITGNTIEAYTPDVNATSVTLFHVFVRDASLEITDPINVTNNALLAGMKGVSIWVNDNEIFAAAEAVLKDTLYDVNTIFNTTLTVSDVNVLAGDMGYLVVTLKDSNGKGLVSKEVIVFVNDNQINAYTGEDGTVSIPIKETNAVTKYVSAAYLGEGNLYKGSIAQSKITVSKKSTTLTAAKTKVSGKVKKAIKVKVTLKAGKTAIKGKQVTVKVNGKTFKGTTNAKGEVTISVKVAKKGTYKAAFKFAGDGAYKASSSKTVKFTVKK